MTNQIIQEVQKKDVKKTPVLEPGMTVRVHQKIKEGDKQRIQIFEGLIIKISHGYGVDKTFTVRKVVEGIGVEKIFPIHSPNIEKIEVKKKSKVRRSKLYYMRERFGKSARLKGRFLTEQEKEIEASAEELAEAHPEAVEEDAEAKAEASDEAPAEDKKAETEAPKEAEAPAEPKPETEAPVEESPAPEEEAKKEE
jgi:large subunit ribosomal protein L19